MVNPFNPDTIPDELFAIITSISRRRGATMNELIIDTALSEEKLEMVLEFYLRNKSLHMDQRTKKFYLQPELWAYWQNTGFDEKIPAAKRSIWLKHSPVKSWYPEDIQPKPDLIYYIGPYKQPYIDVYLTTIKPHIEGLGLSCLTAFEDPGSEEFLKDKILPKLLNARFVICDLSESNPNVHYELGWMHAFGTPFLAFTSNERPSDIHHLTINQISFDKDGLEELKELIRNIEAGRHTLLLSPRKYGKSSLVKNEVINPNLSEYV